MRMLSQEEMHLVCGANFSDDISALAASIMVIQCLHTGAVKGTSHLGNNLYSMMEGSPHQQTVKILTQIAAPLSGVVVPLMIAKHIFTKHPEYWDNLIEKFNTYL